jgi:hypothetical protein
VLFIVFGRYAIGKQEYQSTNKVTEIFIIRGSGSSYMDFNLKFILAISAIAITVYDWRKNHRLDYFWIVLIVTLGLPIEAYVQMTGRRIFHQNYLFGIKLPYLVQLLIQSLSEMSFDTVLLMFLGERMMNEKTRKNAMIVFAAIMVAWLALIFSNGIQTPVYGGEVPSRRVISGTGELAVVLTAAAVTSAFFLTEDGRRYILAVPSKEDKRRGLFLLILLIIYGAVGQIGMYLAGVRWVEIGVLGSTMHAPILIEIVGFMYNFIFEYAFAYTQTFAIAVGLKLIKT